jgi:hypothetical protein
MDDNTLVTPRCQAYHEGVRTTKTRPGGVPPEPKKAKSDNNDDQNDNRRYDNRNRRPERSSSSSVVVKRPKVTGSCDQTQGRSGTSTLKLHNLCIGRSTQSLSPGKIIVSTYLTPGPTRWSSIL